MGLDETSLRILHFSPSQVYAFPFLKLHTLNWVLKRLLSPQFMCFSSSSLQTLLLELISHNSVWLLHTTRDGLSLSYSFNSSAHFLIFPNNLPFPSREGPIMFQFQGCHFLKLWNDYSTYPFSSYPSHWKFPPIHDWPMTMVKYLSSWHLYPTSLQVPQKSWNSNIGSM